MRKADIDGGAIETVLRRAFGTAVPVAYERTAQGVSTQVYRLFRGSAIFYLRVAEEADENLETDAELLYRLWHMGVKVCEVVHVEPFNPDIGRSTMITTEVPGMPVCEVSSATVLEQAGADLATINRIPVNGFGFVRRHGRGWPLSAEYPDYRSFAVSFLPEPWPGPLESLFAPSTLNAIEQMLEHEPCRQAVLAHGDFDTTQIYCEDGRYTGMIDFGEIRGAEPFFDLGHFYLWHHEMRADLLRGYQRVSALPGDHEQAIRRSAVLLGLRQLCRWLRLGRGQSLVAERVRRIDELVVEFHEPPVQV